MVRNNASALRVLILGITQQLSESSGVEEERPPRKIQDIKSQHAAVGVICPGIR